MANLLLLIFAVATVVAATVFRLPTLAWAPLLVAALGVMLARTSAREQVRISERKLFLDLIPRRSEWVADLAAHMAERDKEAARMMSNLLSNQPMGEPVHLMAIWKSQREAKWLFGERMSDLVASLIEAEAELGKVMLKARTGDRQAAHDLGIQALALDGRLGAVMDEAVDYLYVGDIRRKRVSRSPLWQWRWFRRAGASHRSDGT